MTNSYVNYWEAQFVVFWLFHLYTREDWIPKLSSLPPFTTGLRHALGRPLCCLPEGRGHGHRSAAMFDGRLQEEPGAWQAHGAWRGLKRFRYFWVYPQELRGIRLEYKG